jgi:hypothetical protein
MFSSGRASCGGIYLIERWLSVDLPMLIVHMLVVHDLSNSLDDIGMLLGDIVRLGQIAR